MSVENVLRDIRNGVYEPGNSSVLLGVNNHLIALRSGTEFSAEKTPYTAFSKGFRMGKNMYINLSNDDPYLAEKCRGVEAGDNLKRIKYNMFYLHDHTEPEARLASRRINESMKILAKNGHLNTSRVVNRLFDETKGLYKSRGFNDSVRELDAIKTGMHGTIDGN